MKRRVLETVAVAATFVGLVGLIAGCSSNSGAGTDGTGGTEPVTTVAGAVATDPSPSPSPSTVAPTIPASTKTVPPTAADVAFTPFLRGITQPVEIAWRANDASLYLAEQNGKIVPIRNGAAAAPVLDIGPLISNTGEQGLLGLAFHPTKPLAYLDYTNVTGNTVIAEYAVAADGTFDPASARTVLTIAQPYPNHNGGKVVFGPDGDLYIGMGDGGGAGDPDRRAQNKGDLLGKILRIDPVAAGGQPYTIPADNPFVNTPGARGEVWSIGVRNPWRFAFDRTTGDLWIADVGQNLWEEVDVALAKDGAGKGANFGWSALEATHAFNADQPTAGVTMPIHEYAHGDDGCSISGGAVSRTSTTPSLAGWFVYSDFCSGKVWAASADGSVADLGKLSSVSAVAAGPEGEVYVLAYTEGTIYRIDPA